jgi:hypothetical protein
MARPNRTLMLMTHMPMRRTTITAPDTVMGLGTGRMNRRRQ